MAVAREPETRPKYAREIENFVALTLDLAAGRLEWSSRPYSIEYSTNSACNLRCIMCSQSDDPPVVSTPLALQAPFLEEILSTATLLSPSATSEPLLNNMHRLLPLFEKHGVFLDVITNGTLLTPELLAMLLPRLHRLTLSVDSHEKEVFEKLRAPAVFEQVVANCRHATPICREAGVPVVYHMVLARDCLDGLEDYVDFVADLGGTRITVLQLLPSSKHFADLDPYRHLSVDEIGRRIEAMRARAEQVGVGVFVYLPPPLGGEYDYASPTTRVHDGSVLELMHSELSMAHPGFCPMVMGYFKVDPDGQAFPCCKAPKELRLGNVFEQGIEAVWNGAPMQELRRRMFARDYPEPCKTCLVPQTAIWRAQARK